MCSTILERTAYFTPFQPVKFIRNFPKLIPQFVASADLSGLGVGCFQALLFGAEFHYPLSDGDSLVDILRCFVIQRGLRAQGVPDLFQIGSGDPDPGLVQGMWLADVQSPLMDSLVDVGIAEHGGLVAGSVGDDVQHFDGVVGHVVAEAGELLQHGGGQSLAFEFHFDHADFAYMLAVGDAGFLGADQGEHGQGFDVVDELALQPDGDFEPLVERLLGQSALVGGYGGDAGQSEHGCGEACGHGLRLLALDHEEADELEVVQSLHAGVEEGAQPVAEKAVHRRPLVLLDDAAHCRLQHCGGVAHVLAVARGLVVRGAQLRIVFASALAQGAHQVEARLGLQMPVLHLPVVSHVHEVVGVNLVFAADVDGVVHVPQYEQDAGIRSLHDGVDAGGHVLDVGILLVVFDQVHAEFVEAEVGDADAAFHILQVGDLGLHLFELLLAVGKVAVLILVDVVVIARGGHDLCFVKLE